LKKREISDHFCTHRGIHYQKTTKFYKFPLKEKKDPTYNFHLKHSKMAPISTSRMESFIRRAREAIAENHRIRLIAVIPVGRRRSDNGLYIASSFIQPFLDEWEIHGIRQWGLFVRVHPDAANAYIRIDIRDRDRSFPRFPGAEFMFPTYVLQWTETSGMWDFFPYDRSISDRLAYNLDAAFEGLDN
jgi:hypothetical protein